MSLCRTIAVLAACAVAVPAAGNYFATPLTSMYLNIGSVPSPSPQSKVLAVIHPLSGPAWPMLVYASLAPLLPAAIAPERTFVVSFHDNNAVLDAESKIIVRHAALVARQGKPVHVMVASLSGEPTGNNNRLVERRARTINTALQREGLDSRYIVTMDVNSTPFMPANMVARGLQNKRG